ncbi:NAD(P)-dependent alcohol dehydrogenase [Microbacterium aoyamense]|uniref:NAD(P)-dependent alcohol dehydrogenase n=1 Tax=Microbacterium aoyamense TaxID=344166 RepID=A0ABP5B0E9_9MICO|nr:NAD(P)-dependent alcohol dehydrogenase [Microbacterium aoyamense]
MTITTDTMTAWRQNVYGGADTVLAETIPVPRPRKGEVLVRFEAASINSGDIHLMQGEPRLVRLVFGVRRPRVHGRGMDLVGRIVAVGEGVDAFAPGDRVVGSGDGTLAEYVAIKASRVSRVPDGLAPEIAACLPIAGNTAVTVLDACRVGQNSRVLVIGAGGGVGTLTVQLAADRGAEVWATCGARAESLLRELGASRTFDYRTLALSSLPAGSFDAIVDIAGEPPLENLRALLARGGTVALVGGEGGRVLGPIPRMIRSLFAARPGRRFRSITAVTKTPVTARLAELATSGRLTPAIERTYALAEAGAALAHVESGRTVGKVVVTA